MKKFGYSVLILLSLTGFGQAEDISVLLNEPETPTFHPSVASYSGLLKTTELNGGGRHRWMSGNDGEASPLYRLAIKTNLIYDVLLMPSLEVEYRIDDRWSVNLEGEVAWWKNDAKHQYYQIATIIPEGRFWFKTRNPWHGHYAGLFMGGNWYDLEAGKKGVQGEALLVGLSYGYMWPVSRCLSFEAGIGIGYMYTKFEEYLPQDGCYVYQRTKKMHYFGPLKLKLGFVWRLWNAKKKEAQ